MLTGIGIVIALILIGILIKRKVFGPAVVLEKIEKPDHISDIKKKIHENGYDFVKPAKMFAEFKKHPELISSGDYCFTFFSDDRNNEQFAIVHKPNGINHITCIAEGKNFEDYRGLIYLDRMANISANNTRHSRKFYVMITKKSSHFELKFPFFGKARIHFQKDNFHRNLNL